MDGIRFILGIHAHQPGGNFPDTFAEAYRRPSIPFRDVPSEFPHVAFALHSSGVLFDWLEAAHPERLAPQVALLPHCPLGGAGGPPALRLAPSVEGWEGAGG